MTHIDFLVFSVAEESRNGLARVSAPRSHKATMKMSCRVIVSSEAQVGEDLLPSSDG